MSACPIGIRLCARAVYRDARFEVGVRRQLEVQDLRLFKVGLRLIQKWNFHE